MKDYEKIRTLSYKKDFSLKPILALLALLDNPHHSLNFIHVAGTKGKTSVCYYLNLLAQKSQQTPVGLYTSPHLESLSERIQINGIPVKEKMLENKINKIKELAKKHDLTLTFFEVITACAFLIFKEKQVKIVILETGLGGRLDTTNVVTPLFCVLTPIHKDHTQLLGKCLFKIAKEKGGILKPNIPFFVAKQKKRIKGFLRLLGKIKKAPFYPCVKFYTQILSPFLYQIKREDLCYLYEGPQYGLENFLFALGIAKKMEWKLPLKENIKHFGLGRFEVYQNQKTSLVLDGAHNPFAIKKLVQSLKIAFQDKKWVFVFNAFKDKNIKKMIALLNPMAKEFWILEDPQFDTPFAFKKALKTKKPCKKITYQYFLQNPFLEYENLCITGSFYLVGDFKKLVLPKMNF